MWQSDTVGNCLADPTCWFCVVILHEFMPQTPVRAHCATHTLRPVKDETANSLSSANVALQRYIDEVLALYYRAQTHMTNFP